MRAWMAFLVALAACGFETPGGDGGVPGDGEDMAARCFGTIVQVCFNTVADVPKTLPPLPSITTELDTGSATLICNQNHTKVSELCVIAGPDLRIAANRSIRGYGNKALVLLSTTALIIDETATVDVSSVTGGTEPLAGGAAANPASCSDGLVATGSTGGFGGSFGGKGGDGQESMPSDGTGGAALGPVGTPSTLRGGCQGGTGAGGGGVGSGGAGGSGGGAVALIARTSIIVNGTINASGAGGRGGPAGKSGGGGGGSGGMIVLDAAAISAGTMARVFANGGGGGQGGTIGAGGGGDPGMHSTGPFVIGSGGRNINIGKDGGHGGDGSSGGSLGGQPGTRPQLDTAGGGGGGGGAGFIHAPNVPAPQIAPPNKDLPAI